MLLVELPIVVALLFWGRWLGGKYGAPRWVRWVGWPIAAVWAVTGALAVHRLIEGFGALEAGAADPAQKARVLAEGISEAMHVALLGIGVIVAGFVALLVLTWRYHWSAKPPAVPHDPPYR